jgi:RHS repeat-associated protein
VNQIGFTPAHESFLIQSTGNAQDQAGYAGLISKTDGVRVSAVAPRGKGCVMSKNKVRERRGAATMAALFLPVLIALAGCAQEIVPGGQAGEPEGVATTSQALTSTLPALNVGSPYYWSNTVSFCPCYATTKMAVHQCCQEYWGSFGPPYCYATSITSPDPTYCGTNTYARIDNACGIACNPVPALAGTWSGAACATGVVNTTSSPSQCVAPPAPLPEAAKTTPYGVKLVAGGSAAQPTAKGCEFGMCAPNAHLMPVSLALSDTPIGYAPPKGPPVFIGLNYNHLGASQPPSSASFNVGPKWTLNVLSYIEDDTSNPGVAVVRFVAGGGTVNYTTDAGAFNTTTGAFGAEKITQAVLKRIPATGAVTSYELTFPDGTKHVFGAINNLLSPRRVFLSSIVDPAGNALTFSFDASFRLTSITDATSRSTTFTYAHATYTNLVTGIADPFGRTATLAYCTSSDTDCPLYSLKSITDVQGITSSFKYDATDTTFVKSLTTPYGTTNFAYGMASGVGAGRWLTITDPLGFVEKLEYKPGAATGIGATESATPSGMTVVNGSYNLYNTFHWNKHAYADAGNNGTDYTKASLTHWLQDGQGQVIAIAESTKTAHDGRVFFNYPGQSYGDVVGTSGQPSAIGRVLPGGATQVRSFTYNSLSGKVASETDPAGRVTYYDYDTTVGVDLLKVRQKNGAGSAATDIAVYTYPSSSNHHKPLTWKDAAGNTATYTYNAAAQLTQVTDQGSRVTKYAYDGTGRPTTTKRTISGTDQTLLTLAYTANCGLPTYTNNPNCDLPSTVTDSEGRALTYQYDNLDHTTKVTYPDATYEQFTYTTLDLTTARDRLGRNTTYAYNNNRWLTSVTSPVSSGVTRTTSYGYYRTGALNTLTDALGNVTVWDIDLQSRVNGKTYAGGSGGFAQTYDTAGRPSVRTDSLWQTKTIGYNADDSVASITYGNEVNTTPDVSFSYDTYYPRVTGMTDGNGTTGYGYVDPNTGTSGAGKVLWENQPFSGDTLSFGYDVLSRMTSRQVQEAAGNITETWGYDVLDRATSHGTELGSFTNAFNGYTGAPTSRSVTTSGVTVSTAWAYDTNANDRRLTTITNSSGARDFTITANQVRISAVADTASTAASYAARSWSYGYDDADRVTSAGSSSPSLSYTYAYDKLDSFTSFTNTAASSTLSPSTNALNQQSGFGGTFTYDDEGNLTAEPSRTYKWDAENRLVEINFVGISPSVQKVVFKYDGLGRRTHKQSTVSSTMTETRYLWSGDTLLQARNSSNVALKRYYPEGEQRVGTDKLIYMPDHLGSVRDVVNAATGAVVRAQDYSPYGAIQRSWGSVVPDFHYAGLLYEGTSGLQLSKTRAYNGFVGHWLNRDPISEKGGVNLYSYAGADSINYVDRDGLSPALAIPMLVGAAAGAVVGAAGTYLIDPNNATLETVSAGGAVGFVIGGAAVATAVFAGVAEAATIVAGISRAAITSVSSGVSGAATTALIDKASGRDVDWNQARKVGLISAIIPLGSTEAMVSAHLPSLGFGVVGNTAAGMTTAAFSTVISVPILDYYTKDSGPRAGGSCPIPR